MTLNDKVSERFWSLVIVYLFAFLIGAYSLNVFSTKGAFGIIAAEYIAIGIALTIWLWQDGALIEPVEWALTSPLVFLVLLAIVAIHKLLGREPNQLEKVIN